VDANRKRRRRAARLEPGYPQPLAAEGAVRHAALWNYMKRVLVDGETPPCDAVTAAMLAGMVLGQHVHGLCTADGLTLEQGTAAGLRWVAEHAALSGSLAASEAAPADAAPSLERAAAEAARYAGAVMDGDIPESAPEWLPRVLAALWRAAMVAGYVSGGMSADAARMATRARFAAMAQRETHDG